MPVLTRLGALGALSVLAACGTTATVDGEPVTTSELLAAASTFTPTYEGDEDSASDAVESEEGLSGLIGLDDGTIVPVKVQIDREANTMTVTYGDEDPIVLTDGSSGYWSNEEKSFWAGASGSDFNFYDQRDYSGTVNLALMTSPEDLPTSGEVGYSSRFEMSGAETDANGNLALAVDFGTSTVAGSVQGNTYGESECCFARIPEEGPSGNAFFGLLQGSVSDGLLSATGDVSGTVDGEIGLLGGFRDGANRITGGIAGTIDDATMGGQFNAYSNGGFGGPQ